MFSSPAYAQAAGTPAAPDFISGLMAGPLVPMAAVMLVMWFLLFRPQQQRAKEQRAKLDAVKKNDQVVTGGGLIGRVVRVDGDTVEVEIAPNVRVKAVKATLSDVTPTGTKAAND